MSQAPVVLQINIAKSQAGNADGKENSINSDNAQSRYQPESFGKSQKSRGRPRSREDDKHDRHRRRGSSGRRRSSSPDDRSPSPKRQRRHKPTHPTILKTDGSNYSVWLLKIRAAFRHAGIEHVLTKPKKHELSHSSRDCQLGIDILLDLVEDALASKVVKPHNTKIPTPYSVMSSLHQLFGQDNTAMHSILRAALQGLKQAEGEKVTPYTQRAEKMYDDLMLAGGHMSSRTFLQCLRECSRSSPLP